MKITTWRIVHKNYAASAFSGEGAKLLGGRWNPKGYPAVYVADSLSLAMLELIVHLDEDRDIQDFRAIPVTFEDTRVIRWSRTKLPKNWSTLPISDQTQEMGKSWLESKQSLVLRVPSAIVPNDSNFLINPLHPVFSSLEIGRTQKLYIDQHILVTKDRKILTI